MWPRSSRWPSSTHSASAGTRMSQLTHFTTASGASRRLATRPSSSTGRRITAATKSAGWAPTTKATGSRSPRSTAASYKARRSEGELMSIPASLRPRSIRRRTPTLVQPFEGSTTKSIEAEMYGAPSKPCWRLTGSVVRSALSPVSTTSCAGAARAAAHDVADQRRALLADALEEHRLFIALERGRDLGELGGRGVHLE